MPSCCICKSHSGSHTEITLHTIPRSEELRAKWLAVIGRDVSKYNVLCSDHFKRDSFEYRINKLGEVRRYLIKGAVPTFEKHQHVEDAGESSSANNLSPTCHKSDSSCDIEENSCELESSSDIENLPLIDMNTRKDNSTSTRRRKRSTNEDTTCNKVQTVKFVGDLRPEDFTSPECYQVVQKYSKKHHTQVNSLQKKVCRLTKKVRDLKDLLSQLHKKGLLSSNAVDDLKRTISPALTEIIQQLLSTKRNNYPDELKEFAASLMFYSVAAYEYTRQVISGLPHPETVRQWYRKFDFSPGISVDILRSLQQKVRKHKEEGKHLQFGMQADEMHIKKCIESDGKTSYGFVDLGTGVSNDANEASAALVYMLVALNGHFKTPVAYYFINGLAAEERANITKQILCTLHDFDIDSIHTFTFDGTSVNPSTAERLGANFDNIDEEIFFAHPITNQPIYIVLDPCHMMKLARTTAAEFTLLDDNDNEIKWEYLDRLVTLQETEGLHCGTKIRRRHIDFVREKMKVNLAVQALSRSTSDVSTFLESDLQLPDFQGASGMSKFCRNLNDMFDFLNVRTNFQHKNESQHSIRPDNIQEWEKKVDQWIAYIKGLKLKPKDKTDQYENTTPGQARNIPQTLTVLNNSKFTGEDISNIPRSNRKQSKRRKENIPILKSNRRTGFLGLIITMRNVLQLAKDLFKQELVSYFLTYKLSQDHLETYFSVVRRMGGFNNNPSCRQFKAAHKKIATHVHSLVPKSANCSVQDETALHKISLSDTSTNIKNDDQMEIEEIFSHSFDHDYNADNFLFWSEYKDNVISYISGFVVKRVKEQIKKKDNCQACLEALEGDGPPSLLQIRKDRGSSRSLLTTPNPDVIKICTCAEKVLRNEPNLLKMNNVIARLIYRIKMHLPSNLFTSLDTGMFPIDLQGDHKSDLINQILQKFPQLRIHHETKSLKDKIVRFRTFCNRSVIFRNQ